MAAGLAFVVLLLAAVIVLLLIERGGLKGELAAKTSRLDALRASHDTIQDVALHALSGRPLSSAARQEAEARIAGHIVTETGAEAQERIARAERLLRFTGRRA